MQIWVDQDLKDDVHEYVLKTQINISLLIISEIYRHTTHTPNFSNRTLHPFCYDRKHLCLESLVLIVFSFLPNNDCKPLISIMKTNSCTVTSAIAVIYYYTQPDFWSLRWRIFVWIKPLLVVICVQVVPAGQAPRERRCTGARLFLWTLRDIKCNHERVKCITFHKWNWKRGQHAVSLISFL